MSRWTWCSAMLVAVVVTMSLGVAGCSHEQTGPVAASGGGRFPIDSLRDWVSYTDHVAVYAVVDESEIPATKEESERGEGLVGRDVTLKIERVIWSAKDAPPLPDELHMTAVGWVLHDGRRREMQYEEGPRVAVGERYVAPLVRVEDDPQHPEWWPLGVGAQMPLADHEISGAGSWHSSLRDQLSGRSIDDLRASLARQEPDALAAKYQNLRPSERIKAVLRDRGDQGQPAPSERTP
jgi:hypothetical protein